MNGQGNLERTWKVREKSGNLKINGYCRQTSENLFSLSRGEKIYFLIRKSKPISLFQGSYASGKCRGNLKFFKVRELSGNFIICQGKLNFC